MRTTPDLNAEQVQHLRRCAATAHMRRKFSGGVMRVRYVEGPLDGIESIVTAGTASNQFLGWCIVVERFGPVTATYERTSDPTLWQFRSLDVGVR